MALLRVVSSPGIRATLSSAHPPDPTVDAIALLEPLFDPAGPFASLEAEPACALVRDLAFASAELAAGPRARAVVRSTGWEIGLERDGPHMRVSVYRPGSEPTVAQTERPVPLASAHQALLAAIGALAEAEPTGASAALQRGMALAREHLCAIRPMGAAPRATTQAVEIRSRQRGRFVLAAQLRLRESVQPHGATELLRADLHSLLFRGRLDMRVGDSQCQLESAHIFLLAEQLVKLATEAWDSHLATRALLRRARAGSQDVGIQLDEQGGVTLFGFAPDHSAPWRLARMTSAELAQGATSFARSLVKQVRRVDRSQSANLRLDSLDVLARDLAARIRSVREPGSKLNEAPESYRAFAESDTPARRRAPAERGVGRLRFAESWQAAVPGIDLSSLFLCGDFLIVGSQGELACLERSQGSLLWRRPVRRGISILTPAGVARLAPHGRLSVFGLDDGEERLDLRLDPCVGASDSGAIVNAPDLPRMLLVTEGANRLAAVDLDLGELRWRRAMRHSGVLRLRRAGKLVVATGGEPELVGLDLLTGEVLWRHCARHRFTTNVVVDRGELFALGGRALDGPGAVIEHLDPWSGALRWRARLPQQVRTTGSLLANSNAVLALTEEEGRLGLLAFERDSGELRFDLRGGICEGPASCMVVDDILVANTENGELVGIDTRTGNVCYRHVFANWTARIAAQDRPQSFQPVLRCGALFVPQSEVYVVRPSDGATLGRLPDDLIPDQLKVDERCGVYVAEMSGHLAAYSASPSLRLLSTVQ